MTEAPKKAPLDQKLVRQMARALYMTEAKMADPTITSDAIKAGWATGKQDAQVKARRLIRGLEVAGVTMTLAPDEAAA